MGRDTPRTPYRIRRVRPKAERYIKSLSPKMTALSAGERTPSIWPLALFVMIGANYEANREPKVWVMTDKAKLLRSLPKLAGRSVLVVGDVFLDEYITGRATRLSREAPIPVLEFAGRRYLPGGAANPSNNIVALGGMAYQVGVIGDDEAGQTLLAKLRETGIGTDGVVTDPTRPTATQTCIVAQGSLRFPQQLARIDHLDRRPVAGGGRKPSRPIWKPSSPSGATLPPPRRNWPGPSRIGSLTWLAICAKMVLPS